MTVLLSLLLAAAPALAAESASVADDIGWGLADGDHTRWYVETDVVLPQFLWFNGDFNKQARVRTFQVRLVMDCPETERRAHAMRLRCRVADAGLGGVTFKRERGKLQPILDELDAKLTDAELHVVISDRGRVRSVRLRDAWVHPQRNRRINQMNEILRLIAVRALAGFDLAMPSERNQSGDSWVQHTDLIYGAPILTGVRGSTSIVHRAEPFGDGLALIRTEGRGTTVPAGGSVLENIFMGDVHAKAVFDVESGVMVERHWEMAVTPTPSSPLAQGWQGIPYAQRGSLRLLSADDTVDVGPTREWTPSTELPPGTLQRALGPFTWADPSVSPLWGTTVVDYGDTPIARADADDLDW